MQRTMQAMVLTGHGGMDRLDWHEDWPVPQPGPGEVLLKVLACGLNNTDVNTRAGWYSKSVTTATNSEEPAASGAEDPSWGGAPLQFPRIQGADICGEVVQGPPELLGKRVLVDTWLRDWDAPMDRSKTGYVGSECDGGFAQYCVMNCNNVVPVQSALSDAELASFACSYSTAEGMLNRAGVGPEDRVLVTGASGGVGSALLQLAQRRGAQVIGLASEAKHAQLAGLGANLLPRGPQDLQAALLNATGQRKVTVVADIVGGLYFPTLIDALDRGGRYVTSGAIAGPMVDLDLRTLYLNDLTFHGSTVLPPQTFRDLVGYIERGEVKPLLAQSFALRDLHAAQTAFIEKNHVGNIVVVP